MPGAPLFPSQRRDAYTLNSPKLEGYEKGHRPLFQHPADAMTVPRTAAVLPAEAGAVLADGTAR
jgi:hypothetical protein